MLARRAVLAMRKCRLDRARPVQVLLPSQLGAQHWHAVSASTKVINTGSAYEQLTLGSGQFDTMQCSSSGDFTPGAQLRVRAAGRVAVHIVPSWHDGWEIWELGTGSTGRPTVTAEADGAGGLSVSVGGDAALDGTDGSDSSSANPAGAAGGPAGGGPRVAIVIPQMADLDVEAAGSVSVHDKLEAVRAALRSSAGPIRVGRMRAEQLWLHCESGDVAVAGVAEGACSLMGRRVFVRRLMAAEAAVTADEWAAVQSAFVKQLTVDVGGDMPTGPVDAAAVAAGSEAVAAVLIPSLHGHADITVSAAAARAAAERTGGGAAVEVAGVTGSVAVTVAAAAAANPAAIRELGGCAMGPAVRCQLDEAAPGSTTRLTAYGVSGSDHIDAGPSAELLLSLPARGRVTAAGSGTVQVVLPELEAGTGGEVSFDPLGEASPDGAGLLQPGRAGDFRGWPSRNRTTPGVNRGLWPDRDEMLASLRQRAEEQEGQAGSESGAPSNASRGTGKIAPDSRATGLFFHDGDRKDSSSRDGDDSPQFEFAGSGSGRVAVESWIGGVQRKAGLRRMAGAALDALRA